jgi:hypothetical protein
MKNVVVLGSLLLVFYALGALLGRPRRVAIGPGAGPQQPLPPRTYQYKEFTFSLN